MEQGLQKVNHHSHLMERNQRIEAYQNSGQKASTWCAKQGIAVSTHYSWQRKVFQAVSSKNKEYFAELPVRPANTDTAVGIQCGELRVEISTQRQTQKRSMRLSGH